MSEVFVFLWTFLIFTAQSCRCSDSSSSDTNSASTNIVYYSKCDPIIVSKIYKVWEHVYGGWPKNLINTAESNGEEVVISTTDKYYGSDLKCLSSYFKKDYLITKSVYKNGTCIPKNVALSEREGRTISVSKGVTLYRYHVFQEEGVTGIYTCVESGVNPSADSKPDGFVKIAVKSHNVEKIKKCDAIMSSVGIPLKVKYPEDCKCTVGGY